MKLGLLTAAFPDTPVTEVADWSSANGFSMLEIACWPADEGAARRYGGVCHIDAAALGDDEAQQIVGDLGERGIEISGLGYYPNPLDPDTAVREAVQAHLRLVFEAAGKLGVPVVNTFLGADKNKSLAENLIDMEAVWPDLCRHAADQGVRIGIENCPMIFSQDEWPAGNNLAYSPSAWRAMFEATPGDTLGLNLDPSHLVWQMIDIERAIDEFGERIYHFHGKDMEIDATGLYDHGVMSTGIGWQRPRLPGLGQVPWDRTISALYRNGYDHVVCVEHEDRAFEGTDELVKRGFLIARNALAPLIG
ncbi:MAG: sugar phosphate isomerase/epimerase [Acidimicrobiales bacterium]